MIGPLDFFAHLRWLDGRPLLDTIEPYRRAALNDALFSLEPDGRPKYNLVGVGGAGQEELEVCRLDLGEFLQVVRLGERGGERRVPAGE